MITSIFCLCQHLSVTTSLIFVQNCGNCSFVCIYWTVYCLRMHYHSFEGYWVVILKYQKVMASQPFIFRWRNHIFLMIIQIFTIKYFSSNFWTIDPLNMVDPSFFSFLRDLHTDNTLRTNKYTKKIRLGWMELNIATCHIFLELMINCDVSKTITWNVLKRIIFENNNVIALQWGDIHSNRTNGLEIRAIERLKIGRQKRWRQEDISDRPLRHRKFAKLLGNV